jgi:hypothetical protein
VTLLAFQREPEPPPAVREKPTPTRSDGDGAILCGACGGPVAEEAARIEVGGAHSHRFTNPAGFTYDVVCLRQTSCYLQGTPTVEFTWFAGYAWSFALCGSCHTHLGWFYEGPAKFFGLIADRLVTGSASGTPP